jgi:DNA modification methylase
MSNSDLITISEAAETVGKTVHNIRYYIDYKRIGKYKPDGTKLIQKAKNGELRVSLKELKSFLELIDQGNSHHHQAGLDSELGFYNLPERERTKHVHRIHPYLGKFIPQLVEWFLTKYFNEDDIILDPFMGSGTTLVQGNELKMHTVGVDISEFNCRIANVKTNRYNLEKLKNEVLEIENRLTQFSNRLITQDPKQIQIFPEEKMDELIKSLLFDVSSEYLKTWFAERTLFEMMYYKRLIKEFEYQDLLTVLLSRATRSCRLIPHYDLATPNKPIEPGKEYWCRKHNKNCRPIEQLLVKIHNYSMDTVRRISQFDSLRSEKSISVLQGDSTKINVLNTLKNTPFGNLKIDGIYTSPPYVGQIDYHDQHIYAYELFGIKRNDEKEIGPKKSGKSIKAKENYVNGISAVFSNMNRFLKDDAKIFIVANDRFNLYPTIAEKSGLKIVKEHHRAVTKRTEQGNNPYQETIFYMKKKGN